MSGGRHCSHLLSHTQFKDHFTHEIHFLYVKVSTHNQLNFRDTFKAYYSGLPLSYFSHKTLDGSGQ